MMTSFIFAQSPIDIYKNNQGLEFIESENHKLEAITFFSEMQQDEPGDLLSLWNLAVAFYVNKKEEEAEKTLKYLLRFLAQADGVEGLNEWRFRALYNLANIKVGQKKKDEAIDLYQQALEIHPESKEVVVNLELLSQSQNGGGDSNKQQQEKQDKKDQQQDKQKKEEKKSDPKKDSKAKPTPKPFKSKDLSKEDVKRILDELKRQEEKIREKIQDKQPKQKSNGKDW